MTWLDDDELQERFLELRQEDMARAPDFHALTRPARAPALVNRRGFATTTLWIAAAASLVMTAGVALRRAGADDRIVLVSSSVRPELANWRSPTAGLVPTHESAPGSPGWIFTSVLDGATRGLGQLEGAGQ